MLLQEARNQRVLRDMTPLGTLVLVNRNIVILFISPIDFIISIN